MHFHLMMVVWGDHYVRTMLEVGLPSILMPRNLPALCGLDRSQFVFMTSEEDEPKIRAASIVEYLTEIVTVSFSRIDAAQHRDAHACMASAHQQAILAAVRDDAYVIVLSPDSIMSNGTLDRVGQLALAGKNAVMVTGLRLTQETALPALKQAVPQTPGRAAEIFEPRKMLAFGMEHFHPEVMRYSVDSEEFCPHPLVCLWPMPGEGFLQRAFHLHPLMLNVTRASKRSLDALHVETIDGAFVGHAFADWSTIHVEQDSDRILMFSFSSRDDHRDESVPRRASTSLIQSTAYRPNVGPLHRFFFMQGIKLHTSDLHDGWSRLNDETGLFCYEALDLRALSVVDALLTEGGESILLMSEEEPHPRGRVTDIVVRDLDRRMELHPFSLPVLVMGVTRRAAHVQPFAIGFTTKQLQRLQQAAQHIRRGELVTLGRRIVRRLRLWIIGRE